MSEKISNGLFFNHPHERAPEFVLGKISIKVDALAEFIKANRDKITDKGYLYFDVCRGKDDKPYCKLNEFKPKGKTDDGLPF